MAKEIAGLIKLQIKGGAANPSPPVGPALGSKGINIMEFCKQFNARTQEKSGKILPVVITYYTDKSFDFIVKTPPVAVQLIEASKVDGANAFSSLPEGLQKNRIITWNWEFISSAIEHVMKEGKNDRLGNSRQRIDAHLMVAETIAHVRMIAIFLN